MTRLVAGVPIRVRVALAFACAAALVLSALGVFLHQRLAAELDSSLRSSLVGRAGDLAALARRSPRAELQGNHLLERGDDIAQVLDARGHVVAGAPGFRARPLLTPGEARRATAGSLSISRRRLPGDDDVVRLFATPSGRRAVVVGAALESRDSALENLDGLLVLGLPGALILAALAGYVVAGRALAPVEAMRRQAAVIGEGDVALRLPEPHADDEVRRLAQTLNAMLARIEDVLERERTFVADASHELRTPLTRLRAELELALSGGGDAEALREVVASALAETDRIGRLANDLLILARADRGRLPVRREPTVLRDLLEQAVKRAGVAASVECSSELVVPVDPIRLGQAVGNLLDNAARHGGGEVEVSGTASDGQVEVAVRDHGRGMPPDLRKTAFDRFVRGGHAADDAHGAGLGLAIVAAVAAAHGGSASVEEAPGGGTRVSLRLPA
jgi:signal transduction histidine kinase